MNHPNGFTLIELLLVISLIAILSAISVTGITTIREKSTAHVFSSQLFNAIHLARSEAIARQESVFLVPITPQWEQGFMIKTATQVLRTFAPVASQGHLHWRSFPLNRQQLEFFADGLFYAQNGTFWFCMANTTKPVWSIVLNQSGRAKIDDLNEKGLSC